MKKLFSLVLFAFVSCANAQQASPYYAQGGYGIPQQRLAQPDICDFYSEQLTAAIFEGRQSNQPVERTGRYQSLRQNQAFSFVNTPRVLAKVKDLEMNGANFGDLRSMAHILCGENMRGNE